MPHQPAGAPQAGGDTDASRAPLAAQMSAPRTVPRVPKSSLKSGPCRDPRRSRKSPHDIFLFDVALCISGALHAAMLAGAVWLALAHAAGISSGDGFAIHASLVAAGDAWARETAPPPMNAASVSQWPIKARPSAPKQARPPRSSPWRPSPSGDGETAQPDNPGSAVELGGPESGGSSTNGQPEIRTAQELPQGTESRANFEPQADDGRLKSLHGDRLSPGAAVSPEPPPIAASSQGHDSGVSLPTMTPSAPLPAGPSHLVEVSDLKPLAIAIAAEAPPSSPAEAIAPQKSAEVQRSRGAGRLASPSGADTQLKEGVSDDSIPPVGSPLEPHVTHPPLPSKASEEPREAGVAPVAPPRFPGGSTLLPPPNPAPPVQVADAPDRDLPAAAPGQQPAAGRSASSDMTGQADTSPRQDMTYKHDDTFPAVGETLAGRTEPPDAVPPAPATTAGPSVAEGVRQAPAISHHDVSREARTDEAERPARAEPQGMEPVEGPGGKSAAEEPAPFIPPAPIRPEAAPSAPPPIPRASQTPGALQHTAAAIERPRLAPAPPASPNPRPPVHVAEVPVIDPPAAPPVQQRAPTPSASQAERFQADPIRAVGPPEVSIQIERPHAGTTAEGVQTLAGRIVGGRAKGITVHINGNQQLLDLWGTTFEGEVSLRRGSNQIRVVAMGPSGSLAEKSIEVHYVPPEPSSGIRITRPTDGAVLDSPGQDLIEVEGEVTERGLTLARVIFNDFSVPVTVRDGHFSATVPVIAPEITIWVESNEGPGPVCSDPVTIRRQPFRPTKGYALLHLPGPTGKVDARPWLSYRANPADANSPRKVTALSPASAPSDERTSPLYAFSQAQAGAYALAFDYRIAPGESVEKGWGLIFVPGSNGYRSLRLGPFQLTGKGRASLAKFLLPQAIFWDEDSWFTATAEGADSVTKFRYQDGISWTERKGESEFSATK